MSERHNRPCLICGKPLYRPNARTCSDKCRMVLYRREKRNSAPENVTADDPSQPSHIAKLVLCCQDSLLDRRPAAAIAKRLGIDGWSVQSALDELEGKGVVVRTAEGYKLAYKP